MAEALNVAMVGTGGIAGRHARVLSEMAEATVTALVDPEPEQIARFRKRFPHLAECPAYSSPEELLEADGMHAAIICSPHNVHAQQIITCLDAGLHVLVEKPMVSSIEDAHKVIQHEQEADRVVAIAYQRHSQPEFRFIRKCIQDGRAGEVQFVSAFQGQNWMKGTAGSWRQVPEVSCGGQLNDSGSHLIDIILWVTGLRAERVMAEIEDFGIGVDINSALAVKFAEGAEANISVVGNCPIWWEDITIVCSGWTFFLRQGELTFNTGDEGETLKMTGAGYSGESPARNFVESALGRAEVLAPSVCGLRTIELTEAAWESGESGEPVSL